MSIRPTKNAHPAQTYLNPARRYRFFILGNTSGPYAAGALAEHPDSLEVHLEVLRFGPGVLRALRADMEELKGMARRQGKSRLVALRAECGPVPDARWPKFMRLVGFTNHRQYQTAELDLGGGEG